MRGRIRMATVPFRHYSGKKGFHMRRIRTTSCRGQATAELVISLVGLSALFLGFVQVALLGHNNVCNLFSAREKAEGQMHSVWLTEHQPVQDWKNGEDGLSYTADDTPVLGGGSTIAFSQGLASPVPLQTLESNGAFGFRTNVTEFTGSGSAATAAGLQEGKATAAVPVDPALKFFLMNATEIQLTDKAYMPSLTLQLQNAPQRQAAP